MVRILPIAGLAALIALRGDMAPAQPFVPAPAETQLRIEWHAKNRFRLFRNEAHFNRHVAAHALGGGALGAERQLAVASDGRGWARDMVEHLCLNPAGLLVESCLRDGERESFLNPKDHHVAVRLTGPGREGLNCTWSFDDGTPPPRQITAPCTEEMRFRVRYGIPTIAAVGIVRSDGTVDSLSTEIRVRDLLVAGLGDSVAAGEGNPDRPIALDDIGFCFRRFLGSGLSEYYRPSRAGFRGEKACPDNPADFGGTDEWARQSARWSSAACHRSLYSYQFRTALALAIENPHHAVTFIPLACTGATIDSGLLGSQRARECPPTGSCAGSVPGQLGRLRDILLLAQREQKDRALDLVLLTVGANDIHFSGLVADVILTAGVERTLFNQSGLIATVPQAQRILDRELPANFTKLRAALKALVGNLSRVVFVSYGHPGLRDGEPCPGGRDGLDVHPAFAADGGRLRQVTDFVQSRFLPRMKALALCEGGIVCRDRATERMTFVDAHQAAFANHGFCVRSQADPPFDRECFSPQGESFDPDPVSAATKPLVCDQRPSEFRPYAPRGRWVRTANDSYFTAMTYPQGYLQPSNIHDASWGAVSAVYGGAIHPTAEGAAAMADAALRAAREVLELQAPPAVTAEPLPPLPPPIAR